MYPNLNWLGLKVPTYFLILSLVASFCLVFVFIRAKQRALSQRLSLDVSFIILLSGFIGARLTHVVWELPWFYSAHPILILAFWNGGFVFLGGAIWAFAFSYWYLQYKKQNPWLWADFFAPIVAIGYALGRLACLAAGCCFGKYCDLPWGIRLQGKDGFLEAFARHPTQIYHSLIELGIFCLILFIEKKYALKPPSPHSAVKRNTKGLFLKTGNLFLIYLILHSLGRLAVEPFREDYRGAEPLGLSFSSWLSIGFIILAILTLFQKGIFKKEKG